MIELADIERAAEAISPYILKTPLIFSDSLSRMTGAQVYLKCENLQKTGSFKVRGAFNKLIGLKGQGGKVKVVAASMGNHAQGVAYAASVLSLQSTIIMPVGASIAKENAVRAYGAEVVLKGETLGEAIGHALKGVTDPSYLGAAGSSNYTFIHPFDDEEVIAGQGTIGLEVLEDLASVDYMLVPVGGGGLISGIALAAKLMKPDIKVVGVQTEAAPSAARSFKGAVVEVRPGPTIADGIAVGKVGEKTIQIINKYVDEMSTVSEGSIARAIVLFLERKKLVVEGAGAVPLAGVIDPSSSIIEALRGKTVVLILSGGNIDFTLIDRIIHRGLVESGRVGVFEVTVDDTPGALHALTGVISAQRANILNVSHERLGDLPVGKTMLRFTVETRNSAHLTDIISDMKNKGFNEISVV